MKKILVLLISLLMIIGLAGCNDNTVAPPIETPEPEAKDYPRTEDISQGIEDEGESFSYSYDFDHDGEEEDIELEIISEEDWESKMAIRIGDYEKRVEIIDWGSIDAVYSCVIDTEDGVRDLAVITNEQSADPRLRIFKYDEDLTQYEFSYENYDGDYATSDDRWIGYAVSYYFNVNDDDTITIEEQTNSMGMWSVYKTYKMDSQGRFAEIKPDKYEILPDFIEGSYGSSQVEGEEKSMWDKGFIKAYIDFESGEVSLEEGEYFKVLYDDGEDNIYIEKEDGTSGWIYIGYDAEGRYDLNQYFFFLAG